MQHRPRMAYTVDPETGALGRLIVDLPRLFAVGKKPKIVAKDAESGKLVFSGPADEGLIKLLMNRFDSQFPYSEQAIATFRELIRHAHLPPAPYSTKWKKFLRDSSKTGAEQLGSATLGSASPASSPAGGRVRYYRDPEALLDRVRLLAGEIDAGNDAPEIKEELANGADALLQEGIITQAQYRALVRKYVA